MKGEQEMPGIYRLYARFIYIFSFLLISEGLIAQPSLDTDTLLMQHNTMDKKPLKFIIPAAMIGIGALGLENHYIQNVNRAVRHEAMELGGNSNSRIEDGLRYLPAASTFLLQSIGIKGQNKMIDKVFLFALSTAIMDKAVDKLKSKTNELRPDGSNYRSFPSGHTATAFAAAEFMRKEYKDYPLLVTGAYVAATATGALRIYHNSHWLTDVLAGAGLGIASTDLAYYLYPKIKKIHFSNKGKQNLTLKPVYQQRTLGFNMVYKLN